MLYLNLLQDIEKSMPTHARAAGKLESTSKAVGLLRLYVRLSIEQL